jgi:hypothetical protein
MTPQEKNVFGKLFPKTELASHKVELALADDLKAGTTFLQAATDAVKKSITNYETSYKAMQTESNGAKSVLNTQMKLINNIEAKAKELGINPNAIPNYNEINKAWQMTSDAIDRVAEF